MLPLPKKADQGRRGPRDGRGRTHGLPPRSSTGSRPRAPRPRIRRRLAQRSGVLQVRRGADLVDVAGALVDGRPLDEPEPRRLTSPSSTTLGRGRLADQPGPAGEADRRRLHAAILQRLRHRHAGGDPGDACGRTAAHRLKPRPRRPAPAPKASRAPTATGCRGRVRLDAGVPVPPVPGRPSRRGRSRRDPRTTRSATLSAAGASAHNAP